MKFTFEESVGYHLNKTAVIMRNSLQRAFNEKHREITIDHWVILNRLWKKDGWKQTELAEMTGKDNASMTRMLDGMERKSLVERHPDPTDRRVQRIYITQKGRSLEKPLKEVAAQNMKKGLDNVSPEEVNELKRILKKIQNNY